MSGEGSSKYCNRKAATTRYPSNASFAMRQLGVGSPTENLKQADDPCRVIEIVARAGQLYATLKAIALL